MRDRYDAVVVGAGPAGIFAALEFARAGRAGGVLVLEKGHAIERRKCPGRQHRCLNCATCDIMTGWGGAGAFSDGKLTLTTEVGGWLSEYVGREALAGLVEHTDSLWCTYGAHDGLHGADPETAEGLVKRAALAGMTLVPMRIRHLGTDRSPVVLQAMYQALTSAGAEIVTDTEVARVLTERGRATGVELSDGRRVASEVVILAPGREGADWLAGQARDLGIGLVNNAVDIGVRVEVPAEVMRVLTDPLYEAKLIYRSRGFGDTVRTFCMNPYGEVTTECYGDIVTVNGHSYAELRTENTNFAVLVSQTFTTPFREPITYGSSIARLANLLGDGILVQRLGDLKSGHRSTPERIAAGSVRPSMPSATPGDLSFVLPYRQVADILEFLDRLDALAPGVAAPDTLLYGVEVKFYSSRLELGPDLMTAVDGLYAVGDGAGVTRGLVQSSASGIVAARAVMSGGGTPPAR